MKKDGARSTIEWATVLTVLCTMAGTGILQLPLSIAQGLDMLRLIVAVAIMTNRTGIWLIQCLYAGGDSQEGLLTVDGDAVQLKDYASIGERAYDVLGGIVSQIFRHAVWRHDAILILTAKFLVRTGHRQLQCSCLTCAPTLS